MQLIEFESGKRRLAVEARALATVLPAHQVQPAGSDSLPWVGWIRWGNRCWPVWDLAAGLWGRRSVWPGRARVLLPAPEVLGTEASGQAVLVERVTGIGRYRREDFVPGQLPVRSGLLPCPARLDGRGLLHWLPAELLWSPLGRMPLPQDPADAGEAGSLAAPAGAPVAPPPVAPAPPSSSNAAAARQGHPVGAPADDGYCWRRTGSWGDGSCPELARCRHCSDCEVFRADAGLILEWLRPEDRDTGLPEPAVHRLPASGCRTAWLLEIEDEIVAVRASRMLEVCGPLPFHRLPRAGCGVVHGLVQWRGMVLPCVSLRRLLQKSEPPWIPGAPAGPWVVIAEWGGRLAAWPVDDLPRQVWLTPANEGPAGDSPGAVADPCADDGFWYADGRWVRWLDAESLPWSETRL